MRKILFIDDEDTVIPLISQLESFYNFGVTFLQDYRQIDNELQQKEYDAVVLDIMMPLKDEDTYFSEEEKVKTNKGRKTGIVLFDKIREQYPRLPVVFYSAIRGRISCDECAVVVNKPERAQSIAKTINDLIEKVSGYEQF
jgi:CheY-like chemotaxis protein